MSGWDILLMALAFLAGFAPGIPVLWFIIHIRRLRRKRVARKVRLEEVARRVEEQARAGHLDSEEVARLRALIGECRRGHVREEEELSKFWWVP